MIKVRNLSKKYDNITALKNISFDVSEGSICGYIGSNGAGKSTTIKILAGVLAFDSGEVIINDINIKENPVKIKSISGYIPEGINLFNSLKASEYLEFVNKIRKVEEKVFLRRLDYFADYFSFKDNLNNLIGNLSKGNAQKLLIISSLLHNPDIILLDEPLNGLDSSSIILFQDMLKKLAGQGKIIFYCSHLLDILEKISARIIMLSNGEIKMDKPLSELKTSPEYSNLENLFKSEISDSNSKSFSYDEAFN